MRFLDEWRSRSGQPAVEPSDGIVVGHVARCSAIRMASPGDDGAAAVRRWMAHVMGGDFLRFVLVELG